jgi:hypothetical protein
MNKKNRMVSTSRAFLAVAFTMFLADRMPAGDFAAGRPDILIADFEGETYGAGWKTTGTAFGRGPAKGTLPNQMPVTGAPVVGYLRCAPPPRGPRLLAT